MDLIGRVNILRAQKSSKELPLSTAADLLDVNRTSAYYAPADPSEQELTTNFERLHSALDYQTPAENYYSALMTQVA